MLGEAPFRAYVIGRPNPLSHTLMGGILMGDDITTKGPNLRKKAPYSCELWLISERCEATEGYLRYPPVASHPIQSKPSDASVSFVEWELVRCEATFAEASLQFHNEPESFGRNVSQQTFCVDTEGAKTPKAFLPLEKLDLEKP